MIITRAEMQVVAQLVLIAANDHQHFAMSFQTHQAVDHVDAGFLELPRPVDVVGLVEASPKLDQDGDLLAFSRRPD